MSEKRRIIRLRLNIMPTSRRKAATKVIDGRNDSDQRLQRPQVCPVIPDFSWDRKDLPEV